MQQLILFIWFVAASPAWATFPRQITEPAAIGAIEKALAQAGADWSRAHDELLDLYEEQMPEDGGALRASTVAEIVTRSNVEAQVIVTKTYVNIMAGGHELVSLSSLVSVEVDTTPETGEPTDIRTRVNAPTLIDSAGARPWRPAESCGDEMLTTRSALPELPSH